MLCIQAGKLARALASVYAQCSKFVYTEDMTHTWHPVSVNTTGSPKKKETIICVASCAEG